MGLVEETWQRDCDHSDRDDRGNKGLVEACASMRQHVVLRILEDSCYRMAFSALGTADVVEGTRHAVVVHNEGHNRDDLAYAPQGTSSRLNPDCFLIPPGQEDVVFDGLREQDMGARRGALSSLLISTSLFPLFCSVPRRDGLVAIEVVVGHRGVKKRGTVRCRRDEGLVVGRSDESAQIRASEEVGLWKQSLPDLYGRRALRQSMMRWTQRTPKKRDSPQEQVGRVERECRDALRRRSLRDGMASAKVLRP